MNSQYIKVNWFWVFVYILHAVYIVHMNQCINLFFCVYVEYHTILIQYFLRVSKKKGITVNEQVQILHEIVLFATLSCVLKLDLSPDR